MLLRTFMPFALLTAPVAAQAPVGTMTPTYADLADLALSAPVVAAATVRSTVRLKGVDMVGVPAGRTRLYVEADVTALVRGTGGLAPRVGYLLDVAPDARGKLPQLKKMRVLLFARPAPVPGQLQLVAPDAQLAWSPELEARTRAVAREVVAADAPPRITGIGNAFHVAGALPGEGETQVFLQTADARPVSLSILRRPGERPRWAVALAEIVDETAGPPAGDTLLWYRLACSLPPVLPAAALAQNAPADAEAARADYRFVQAALGPCARTRVSGGGAPG